MVISVRPLQFAKALSSKLVSPEGNVSLDFGGKMNGRGAYICPDPECLKKALRSKALDRSLEVTIPEEVIVRLEKEMENANG